MRNRTPLNIDIGQRIKEIRKSAGLTQEMLSEKLEISTHHVSEIERGFSSLTIEILNKLCNALNISADYVIRGNTIDQTSLILERLIALDNEKLKAITDILQTCVDTVIDIKTV